MSLPGLSLPGLGPPQSSSTPLAHTIEHTIQASRTENLPAQSEWRFEVAFSQQYSIKLESGHAEMFGVELALKQVYTFSGCKGAILTWTGCQLEITGNAESEYSGQETEYAIEWLNVHGMLETLQAQNKSEGPRVLVVGPDFVGKTSLVRSLMAWQTRSGHLPTVLNLDPRDGLLAPPGTLTAVTVDSQMEVESGYGIAPLSGPTLSPVRTPLIYHFPFQSPTEKPDVYKAVITRMALSVMNKMEGDAEAKRSGIILDTPGSLNDPKSNYDLIAHIVSEMSINIILTLGSERLSSDLSRRFATSKTPEETVTVLRVAKPGGAVERDGAFLKQVQKEQIRNYFFGQGNSLNPHSHSSTFEKLNLFRAKSASIGAEQSFAPGDENDDDDYDVPYATKRPAGNVVFEKVSPSSAMTGSLVAIKFCPGTSDENAVRDSAVMGFLYVAEVNEGKKNVRFLAPHPQQKPWADRALVWGHGWPEAVGDLVA